MAKFKIVIEFECDQDQIPGWGHQPEDWIKLITTDFKKQNHYNTSFHVQSVYLNDYDLTKTIKEV